MYELTQYFIQSVHEFDMYDILTSIISEFHLLPQKCPEIEESQFILCSGVLRNKNGSVSHAHIRNRLQNSTAKLIYKCILVEIYQISTKWYFIHYCPQLNLVHSVHVPVNDK